MVITNRVGKMIKVRARIILVGIPDKTIIIAKIRIKKRCFNEKVMGRKRLIIENAGNRNNFIRGSTFVKNALGLRVIFRYSLIWQYLRLCTMRVDP